MVNGAERKIRAKAEREGEEVRRECKKESRRQWKEHWKPRLKEKLMRILRGPVLDCVVGWGHSKFLSGTLPTGWKQYYLVINPITQLASWSSSMWIWKICQRAFVLLFPKSTDGAPQKFQNILLNDPLKIHGVFVGFFCCCCWAFFKNNLQWVMINAEHTVQFFHTTHNICQRTQPWQAISFSCISS